MSRRSLLLGLCFIAAILAFVTWGMVGAAHNASRWMETR